MTIATFNIGTKTRNADTLTQADIEAAFREVFEGVGQRALRSIITVTDNGDEEEDTVVITAWVNTSTSDHIKALVGQTYYLSTLLDQECIAYSLDFGVTGNLVGPRWDKWAPFNPEYFIAFGPQGEEESFNVPHAPKAQREAIQCVTELHGRKATEWFAGPYGEAYTRLLDSEEVERIWVVTSEGQLRRAPTIV